MAEPFHILVVCLGNVCRSPVAERLLHRELASPVDGGLRPPPTVSSAGVRAMVGSPMQPEAAAELARRGGDPGGFVSRQLTPALVSSADLVLVATRSLRSRVLEENPRGLKRTFTIREFAALSTAVVEDGTPPAGPSQLVARALVRRGAVAVPDYDVADPMGKGAHVHRQVAEALQTECTRIARAVVASLPGQEPGR